MRSLPFVVLVSATLLITQPAPGADRKAIDEAVKAGVAFLEGDLKAGRGNDGNGIGPVALAGLALLESGRPANSPAIKDIATAVRDAAYSETRTYQISLCVFFLDKLGDPADKGRIQMLAVRLLTGQNANGGWSYDCIAPISKNEERRLRNKLDENQLETGDKGAKPKGKEPKAKEPKGKEPKAKPPAKGHNEPAGKLLPDIEHHRRTLVAAMGGKFARDDNSNTQFALLAVWISRKHGVSIERSMQAVEKRFLNTQMPSGGWPYSDRLDIEGSPSMSCAGLLGLATAVGRREERRLKAEPPVHVEPKAAKSTTPPKPDDPFFSPAADDPKPKPKAAPKEAPKKRLDQRDKAVAAAFDNLAGILGGNANRGKAGPNALFPRGRFNDRDMYFLWSLERVGVIYGLDKIGRTDWYQFGAEQILRAQNRDGSWGDNGYGPVVNTSFALLFLARSNLVRDLTAKVQKDPFNVELRSGAGQAAGPAVEPRGPIAQAEPMPANPEPKPGPKANPAPVPNKTAVKPEPTPVKPVSPMPTEIVEPVKPKPKPLPLDEASGKLADALLKVPAASWPKALQQVRDGKGGDFTKALVLVVHRVNGDRKKEARTALEERLSRMSAATLRGMVKAVDAELRRAAILACAMREDKTHIPDLIARLTDEEEAVVRAARAALKSLSGGKDFGPEAGSTKLDRAVAVEQWKTWWAKQKK
ncbi:MAG TPA: hypothetical protein VGI99_14265 [Gemmataceae bacterium]